MRGRTIAFLWRVLVVLGAAGAVVVAVLPDPARPVLVAAGAALASAVLAAASRWRLAGTATLGLVTLTVLLAAALDASALRPVQVVAAGVLLLATADALERCEAGADRPTVTVVRTGATARLGPPVLAVGAASLVAVTAAQDVVPSVGLVLAGLVAAVAALVVGTRAHRG